MDVEEEFDDTERSRRPRRDDDGPKGTDGDGDGNADGDGDGDGDGDEVEMVFSILTEVNASSGAESMMGSTVEVLGGDAERTLLKLSRRCSIFKSMNTMRWEMVMVRATVMAVMVFV